MIKIGQAILNFFTYLLSIIGSVFSIAISIITSLVQFISMIPTYLMTLISSISFLPTFLIPFATACVTISVVQYILNRKAG